MNERPLPLLPPAIPDSLYHYCSAESFFKIICSRQLWLCSCLDMNDISEVRTLQEQALSLIKKARFLINRQPDHPEQWDQQTAPGFAAALGRLPETLGSEKLTELLDEIISRLKAPEVYDVPFLASFSMEPDLLSQWIKYADAGAGFCIEFDTQKLLDLFASIRKDYPNYPDPSFRLVRVEYSVAKADDFILEQLAHLAKQIQPQDSGQQMQQAAQNFAAAILSQACTFKDHSFQEEAEVRIIASGIRLKDGKIKDDAGLLRFACINSRIKAHLPLDLSSFWNQNIIRSVTVGPAYTGSQSDLELFVDAGIRDSTPLIRSSIPYRRLR